MQAPLDRGKACSRCRYRKMRCDGVRPACGNCERHGEDCEYLDGPGPTQNQLLESEIARLESRINTLTANSAPVSLHDPYAAWHERQRSTQRTTGDNKRALVQLFIQHATEFGFFLHIDRFLDRVFVQSPQAGHNHILMDVIYLLGARLSNNPQIQSLEPAYLDRAQRNLQTVRPEHVNTVEVLQAEVLLANYFFNSGRQLEGVYHTSAAVSIAYAANFHRIRSANDGPGGNLSSYHVAPPQDALEEGERINGFWTVFILDRCWSIASGSSPSFTDDQASGTHIDTPWPKDLSMYQSHPFHSSYRSSRTVQSFIAGIDGGNAGNQSILALQAQAAILYAGAERLASRYNPYELASQASFLSLDNRIERFKQDLPRLDRIDPSRDDILRGALLMHTIAHCASIQLHTPLVQHRVTANSRTYQAAHAAVKNLRHVNIATLSAVNPFMGILWGSVAKVIAQAVATGRRQHAAGVAAQPGLPDERTLQSELNRVAAAMEQNAALSPLMSSQINALRGSSHSLS